MPTSMLETRTVILACALAAATLQADAGDSACDHAIVDAETMREVIGNIDGYDTGATTNQSRFVADFLLGLTGHPALDDARTFQIQPDRFLNAWLDATGRPREEAPLSMTKVLEFNQRFAVDTRPELRYEDPEAPEPRRELSVRVSWPAGRGQPSHYGYHDTLAEPDVRMRHARVITYQLIDFGDWIAYENLSGVAGRPTSGALSALFGLLGMARIRSTRLAVADDDMQVLRSRVRKLFEFTSLVTIAPDGRARRGIPDGRSDLRILAERLDADLDVEAEASPPEPCDVSD